MHAAREAPEQYGEWEYLVKWEEGGSTWEPAVHLDGVGEETEQLMQQAREYLKIPRSMWEALEMESSEGEGVRQAAQRKAEERAGGRTALRRHGRIRDRAFEEKKWGGRRG